MVVIEDLHWAEPTLLELLAYLGASEADAPLLVLGTARPEAIETRSPIFTSNGSRRALRLDALSIEDSTMLISELVPAGVQVPVERLLEASGGNPLFLEETVRMMAEVGAGHEGGQIPVPSNIHALIASRLDQLGPAEKSLAQNASVIGTTFWPSAVAAMNGIGGDLEDGLAELERRDLVRPTDASRISGEREYGFKHVLIREVSYGQVPKGRRAVLHRRFADWADAQPGLGDDFIEVVAYHLEQACLTARDGRPAARRRRRSSRPPRRSHGPRRRPSGARAFARPSASTRGRSRSRTRRTWPRARTSATGGRAWWSGAATSSSRGRSSSTRPGSPPPPSARISAAPR